MNFVFGPNASGKSSLIEAIYFLGRARSFRENNWRSLRRDGQPYVRVLGKLRRRQKREIRIGVERSDKETRIRIDGRTAQSTKELLNEIPLLLVQPESHRLLELGPAYRRQFLDWGVFHVEHRFYPAWQRYRKAWRQRNAVLRESPSDAGLSPWEQEMDLAANDLDQQRERYLEKLLPRIRSLGASLLGIGNLTLRYQRGWPSDENLGVTLRKARQRDSVKGYTHHGPHRADLTLYIGDQRAASRVSRGQQKLLIFSLVLAQAGLLQDNAEDSKPVLLVDDLAAELDPERVERLVTYIQDAGMQVFVTGTDRRLFPDQVLQDGAVFHVEHGKVRAVV